MHGHVTPMTLRPTWLSPHSSDLKPWTGTGPLHHLLCLPHPTTHCSPTTSLPLQSPFTTPVGIALLLFWIVSSSKLPSCLSLSRTPQANTELLTPSWVLPLCVLTLHSRTCIVVSTHQWNPGGVLGHLHHFIQYYASGLYFHAFLFCDRFVLPQNPVKKRNPAMRTLTLGFKSQLLLLPLLLGIICFLTAPCWHIQKLCVCVNAHLRVWVRVPLLPSLGWRGLRES